MTQENLTKIANLLVDTFISIEEVSIIQNHVMVAYHTQSNQMDVAYEPVPENDDDVTVAILLMKLQNHIIQNTHPVYFSRAQ